MNITRIDPCTHIVHTLELPLTQEQYLRWKTGEPLHTIAPWLTPRELHYLITGHVPEEWRKYVDGLGLRPTLGYP